MTNNSSTQLKLNKTESELNNLYGPGNDFTNLPLDYKNDILLLLNNNNILSILDTNNVESGLYDVVRKWVVQKTKLQEQNMTHTQNTQSNSSNPDKLKISFSNEILTTPSLKSGILNMFWPKKKLKTASARSPALILLKENNKDIIVASKPACAGLAARWAQVAAVEEARTSTPPGARLARAAAQAGCSAARPVKPIHMLDNETYFYLGSAAEMGIPKMLNIEEYNMDYNMLMDSADALYQYFLNMKGTQFNKFNKEYDILFAAKKYFDNLIAKFNLYTNLYSLSEDINDQLEQMERVKGGQAGGKRMRHRRRATRVKRRQSNNKSRRH